MTETQRRTDRPEPQPEPELAISKPKSWAAGVPGVGGGMADSWEQMGVTRSVLTLKSLNQPRGFDCPGCAWPEPSEHHIAEFCENGMKAVAEEATVRRIGPDFFKEHSVDDLRQRPDYWLGQQGRLTHPVVVRPGSRHYEPISWDAAFSLIADELHALGSPDEAVFYTSGRTSNEAAFLYQLFVRAFGTNNLPDCSNMCHESSGSALSETIGIGKGSVTLESLYQADLIMIAGQNPGTNHPRMLTALEKARENGAHIVAINPLPESGLMRFKNPQKPRGVVGHGIQLAEQYLQLKVNGDLALFQALNALLLDAEDRAPGTVLDHAFIAEHTAGFGEFATAARQVNWADVAEATGLARTEIEELADRVLHSERIVVCWAMGLTQHKNSVPTIREVVNFLLLRGNIGRTGAGVLPVRGHSNVQGDRTMGIWEKPKPAFLDALAREFNFEPPREHGFDVVDSIRAMRDGKVKVFFSMGGNFASATPDTDATIAALESLGLNVQVSTKLNRSHTIVGHTALILPTLGRTEHDLQDGVEQFVSVEDSMGVVHSSSGVLRPASRYLKSEVAIVCELAQAVLGTASPIPWRELEADYDRIRDSISRVVPGFEGFNARVRVAGGFLLPHAARDSRTFKTSTNKANFTVNPLEILRPGGGRLILQTVRSHDQYNTTIYGLNDRYRGIHHGRRVVFVNPDDLQALGFSDGEIVDIVSEWTDGVERRAREFRVVAYPTAKGCAAAYFPEANVLVPLDSTAEVSNTPVSKSTIIRLEHREAMPVA